MKRYIIAALTLLIVGGGVATYFVVKHNNDVAHNKAVAKARAERVERAYRENLRRWRIDDQEWQLKNTAYQGCKTATADAFGAADEVQGVSASGGSRQEFLKPIQDLGTEIHGATRAADGNFDCLTVLLKLSKAQDKFGDAMNTWLTWLNGDGYQWADKPDDLPLDKDLNKGADYVSDAETALSDMEPGSRPVKPERGGSYSPPVSI